MTIGIYCIEHIESGKKYIGKSTNIEKRFRSHKCFMRKQVYDSRVNRYLFNYAKLYGLEAFSFTIIETFEALDERRLSERELFWMDNYNTCDRDFGFNLMRDSVDCVTLSDETKELFSQSRKGIPKTQEWKDNMSKILSGRTISARELEFRLKTKAKFDYLQYAVGGVFIRRWTSNEIMKSEFSQPDVSLNFT